jgi:hypothetical protein
MGIPIGLLLTAVNATEENAKVAMWLEVLQRIFTSVGGLGTFIALVFVVRQFNLLHAQSELMQKNILASMDGQLYARLDSFNKFIVEHDEEYNLLTTSYEEQNSPNHRSKLHHLCDLGFTFYEEIYKHHVRYQLLDTEDWDEWQKNMAHFLSKAYVRGYWATVAERYAKSFQSFANGIVARVGSRQTAESSASTASLGPLPG